MFSKLPDFATVSDFWLRPLRLLRLETFETRLVDQASDWLSRAFQDSHSLVFPPQCSKCTGFNSDFLGVLRIGAKNDVRRAFLPPKYQNSRTG